MSARGRVRRAAASLFSRSVSWDNPASSVSLEPETTAESEFLDTEESLEEQSVETEPEYHVPAPEQGMPGRWVACIDSETRKSRARTLARLLGLHGAVQPEVALVLIAAEETAPSRSGGRVIVAVPGLITGQVLEERPGCLLIDENALGQEPWGVPDLGPHRSTVDELADFASLGASGVGTLVVRVSMSRVEEPDGAFGLDNGYRELRRALPFEVEARSWPEAFSLLDSFRVLSTWESNA